MTKPVPHVWAARQWRVEYVICPHCGEVNMHPDAEYPDDQTLLTFPICPRCRKEYVIERVKRLVYRAYIPNDKIA